ncbi:oligoendopeptidase F [Mycoplasmopsis felis]|uniref:oligoendopeptidase F n=1 Tax=Mycoplasmopsis felis TaxID=33923 RepID=UPI002B0024DA|nr:oligoendopeptidase F [Mycoplasmopsis felis]WQQ10179.1 oligoendopeptidase F [Mycoplasmopsis felis]
MKAKQFSSYKDIPKQYKFDLDDILKGKQIDSLIEEFKSIKEQRIKIKDSKYNSIEEYLADIDLSEKETILSFKIHNYISNNLNTDLINPVYKKLDNDFNFLNHELDKRFGSEENRFFANIEKMKIWKNDPRLLSYKRHIEDQISYFEHKLDDNIEEYLIKTSIGQPDPHKIFSILSNSELDYGIIKTKNGKKIILNPTNYHQLLKNDDEEIRKQTYTKYWNAYISHKDTFAELLYQHFKSLTTEAEIRKYKSAVNMLTSKDKVSDAILLKLFEKVSQSRNILKTYKKWNDKFYKIKFKKDKKIWDSARELVNVKTNYTVSEMNELAKESLKPFGSEYYEQVNKAINENWIDYMSTKTKRSGAYSIGGTYGIDKKYILMNFEGTLRSVETLVHELGHSMHSYFSDKNQDLQGSQYPIFLAEIASIYNELMLSDYLLKNSKDDKFKFKILDSMIQGFIGTVLKQVNWANYEYDLYQGIASGQVSSSYDSISKVYYQNNSKYSLTNQKYSILNTIQSIYVPHYYYGFYVYKYAIGHLVGIYFFKKYKTEGQTALKNYIDNFLSAGGSDYPINILKKVGVDLEDNQFYEDGFTFIQELIQEWLKLGKKIFKIK